MIPVSVFIYMSRVGRENHQEERGPLDNICEYAFYRFYKSILSIRHINLGTFIAISMRYHPGFSMTPRMSEHHELGSNKL